MKQILVLSMTLMTLTACGAHKSLSKHAKIMSTETSDTSGKTDGSSALPLASSAIGTLLTQNQTQVINIEPKESSDGTCQLKKTGNDYSLVLTFPTSEIQGRVQITLEDSQGAQDIFAAAQNMQSLEDQGAKDPVNVTLANETSTALIESLSPLLPASDTLNCKTEISQANVAFKGAQGNQSRRGSKLVLKCATDDTTSIVKSLDLSTYCLVNKAD